MYGLLQPIFPKWFELVLLKHAQTISHGSPPFVGGTLCGKKNALFSTQSSRKSVTFGTVPFFFFGHQKPCEKDPRLFPDLLCPFLILLLCFPGENER